MQTQSTDVSVSLQTVDSVLQALWETWNRHDMDAMAELFAEDADFVNVLGMRFKSRKEIEAAHKELHKQRFANTEVRQLQADVVYLNSDTALAHVRWKMTGDPAVAGGLRRGTMTHVLIRKNSRWYFRATQNTDIVYLPELAGHPFWSQYM